MVMVHLPKIIFVQRRSGAWRERCLHAVLRAAERGWIKPRERRCFDCESSSDTAHTRHTSCGQKRRMAPRHASQIVLVAYKRFMYRHLPACCSATSDSVRYHPPSEGGLLLTDGEDEGGGSCPSSRVCATAGP